VLALTFRTWLRYVVPLTLIAALALCPVAYVAWRANVPADLVQARSVLHLGWLLAATAWMFQLVLVAAAVPAVRGVARDEPLAQGAALLAGVRGLARALVPCGVAVAAIVIGGVALVVPGLVLLVLFALTGASPRIGEPLPAPLTDSVAMARANLRQVGLVVALVVAADLAIAAVMLMAFVPALPKKPPAELLVHVRACVRIVAVALIAVSPIAACALAAAAGRDQRRG
jgi:hypothetical protein